MELADAFGSVKLLYRFVVATSALLILLAILVPKPDDTLANASLELNQLEKTLDGLRTTREANYTEIYKDSPVGSVMQSSAGANHTQPVSISVIDPPGIAVPDQDSDPQITIGDQLRWLDNLFANDLPYFFCATSKNALKSALNHLAPGQLTAITITNGTPKPGTANRQGCSIAVDKTTREGPLTVATTDSLAVQTKLETVENIRPWRDLDDWGWLKEHGVGDPEDERTTMPALHSIWGQVSNRHPFEAEDLLKQLQQEQTEKTDRKIELFGQTIDGPASLLAAVAFLLCSLFYLCVLLVHIVHHRAGQECLIRANPVTGFMAFPLGIAALAMTLVILPTLGAYLGMIVTLGQVRSEWVGPAFLLSRFMRYTVVFAVFILGFWALRLLWRAPRA